LNIQLYESLFEKGLDRHREMNLDVCQPDPALVGRLEVTYLRFLLQSVEAGTLKQAGTPVNLNRSIDLIAESFAVLRLCCQLTKQDHLGTLFEETCARARSLSTNKNHDYGAANIAKGSTLGLFVRIGDKLSRISNALLAGAELRVADEKLLDTAVDLLNYTIYIGIVLTDEWMTYTERLALHSHLIRFGGSDLLPYYEPIGVESIQLTRGPAVKVKPTAESIPLRVKRLHPDARLPVRAHDDDAGLDFFWLPTPDDKLKPFTRVFELGVAIEIPPGWYLQLRERSGHAKHGLAVIGGVIDAGYRGPLRVVMTAPYPSAWDAAEMQPGSRICQGTLHRVPQVEIIESDELTPSARGTAGFGSTGVR